MKKLYLIIATFFAVTFTSCTVMQQVAQQMAELEALTKCEFNLDNITNVSIAGIKISDLKNGNIGIMDGLKLSNALLNKQIPINMDVNIDITNPSIKTASMNVMDWICEINGTPLVSGTNNEKYVINANSTSKVPLNVTTDIYSLFSETGVDALKTFVKTFTDENAESKVTIKVKPSLAIGATTYQYPDYFKIEKKITASSIPALQN